MKVKELLSDETKWTQKSFARDKVGKAVSTFDTGAVCWCLYGAVLKCYFGDEKLLNIANLIRSESGGIFMSWNDSPNRTFEEIRTVVEKLDI